MKIKIVKNIMKKFRHTERIIRRFFGIRPRNHFMNLRPYIDRAIEENYLKLKKQNPANQ